jgi:Raf kinase inhibitor-like YbhB/YbcL family protein
MYLIFFIFDYCIFEKKITMKRIFILCTLIISGTIYSQTFTLKSKDIGGQATMKQVFNGFGCTGDNISPQLWWENAPKDTKSFALTMYDPDAPTGSGWWHWVIFDIPANITELKSGAGDLSKKLAPAGSIQSKTDFGGTGYGGPCPPEGHGFHTYIFTIYALNVDKLGLDENAAAPYVGFNINSHIIEKATIVMYYKR